MTIWIVFPDWMCRRTHEPQTASQPWLPHSYVSTWEFLLLRLAVVVAGELTAAKLRRDGPLLLWMSSPWKNTHTYVHTHTHTHTHTYTHTHTHTHKLKHINSYSQLTCQNCKLWELRGPRSTTIPYNKFIVCRLGDEAEESRGEDQEKRIPEKRI